MWFICGFSLNSSIKAIRSKYISLNMKSELIIGLNKYSHDTSCCIIDSSTGNIIFTQSKERISRIKHDGGDTSSILTYALNYLGATQSDVAIVVSNNHLHRIQPYERRLPFAAARGHAPPESLSEANLLPKAKHLELSHHLAHAYSVAGTCPFDEGLVLCMDGMGESYRAMMEDLFEKNENSITYMHDLKALRSLSDQDISQFVGVPRNLVPGAGYREAESAYILRSSPRHLIPLFKRWTRERSPSELFNYGFENMESLG